MDNSIESDSSYVSDNETNVKFLKNSKKNINNIKPALKKVRKYKIQNKSSPSSSNKIKNNLDHNIDDDIYNLNDNLHELDNNIDDLDNLDNIDNLDDLNNNLDDDLSDLKMYCERVIKNVNNLQKDIKLSLLIKQLRCMLLNKNSDKKYLISIDKNGIEYFEKNYL